MVTLRTKLNQRLSISEFASENKQPETGMSKKTVLIFVGMTLIAGCALGKPTLKADHGVVGTTFEIEEEDLLEVITQKLKKMEEGGGLDAHHQKIAQETTKRIKRPPSVPGIRHTTKGRVFTYDPSMTVPYDLTDHEGTVFHSKGTKVNPLDYQALSKPLLFIDGDDEFQVQWALKQESPSQIILTNGSPFELMVTLDRPIYFDQEGSLTKKLGITQVPAKVTQQDKHLLIEELQLQKEGR